MSVCSYSPRACVSRPTAPLVRQTATSLRPLLYSSVKQKVARQVVSRNIIAAASAETKPLILVQGRHLEITDAIKAYAEEKVAKAIGPFSSGIKEVDIKLSVRGGDRGVGPRQQKTEVTVYTLRNGVVRTEDVEDSLYASIDLVSDKLARKMRKVKEKAIQKGKWEGHAALHGPSLHDGLEDRAVEDPADGVVVKREAAPAEVVRVKKYMMEPTTVQAAIDEAYKLGHDFYVFRNKDTDTVQVVYRRKEAGGGYGLIIPDNYEAEDFSDTE